MYKYEGNTGRYVWVPDPVGSSQPRNGARRGQQLPPPRSVAHPEPPHSRSPRERTSPLPLDLGGGLQDMLSNVFPDGFEMEDALLLLVLFLMYKESGDKELLIIMGAMFLL